LCAVQIHYGYASLSALSRLPCYFVFCRLPLDTAAVAKQILQHAAALQRQGVAALLVLLDQPFSHAAASLQQAVDAGRLTKTGGNPATRDSSGIQLTIARSQPGSLDPVERDAAATNSSHAGSACCSSGVSAVPHTASAVLIT
jgi:diphthamide biosynthesis enzyme Dph1/Dph2-like protein